MAIFKKSNAVFVESMNSLKNVSISEDKVLFNLNYSNIELSPEKIPGLVSDLIQVYGIIKPTLDKMSAEQEKAKEPTDTDEPIDLSNIPF